MALTYFLRAALSSTKFTLLVYVAAHANLIHNALWSFGILRDLLEERFESGEPLRVCSLGGGPGSELLGLTKYAERIAKGRCLDLDFTLVDNVTEWDETWNTLRSDIEQQFRAICGTNRNFWPIRISHSFLPLDLGNPTTFQNLPTRFLNIDLFIMNFVVFELEDDVGDLSAVLRLLVERVKDSAQFLFVDRIEERIRNRVEAIIEVSGLNEIGQVEQNCYMDYDEQKDVLNEWLIDLDWSPKVRLNAFYILAAKEPFLGLDDIPF